MWDYGTNRGGFASEACAQPGQEASPSGRGQPAVDQERLVRDERVADDGGDEVGALVGGAEPPDRQRRGEPLTDLRVGRQHSLSISAGATTFTVTRAPAP